MIKLRMRDYYESLSENEKVKKITSAATGTDSVVYTRDTVTRNGRNLYIAIGFCGKRQRESFNLSWYTEVERDRYIENWFTNISNWEGEKRRWKEDAAEEKKRLFSSLQAGDVFFNTFGYEETHASFFQVIQVKKASVIMREIRQSIDERDHCGYASPIIGDFSGEPITVMNPFSRFLKWDNKPVCVTSAYGGGH